MCKQANISKGRFWSYVFFMMLIFKIEMAFAQTYCGGIADSFYHPIEPVYPDLTLIDKLSMQYDSIDCFGFLDFDDIPGYLGIPLNSFFVHKLAFTVRADTILKAILKIRLRAAPAGQTETDFIAFFEGAQYITGSFLTSLPESKGTWLHNQDTTFTLDLGDLPPGFVIKNILSYLEDGDIDIVVGNETGVDYMCLELPTVYSTMATGWNMVSIPSTVPDYSKNALFPTAISDAYWFQGGYISKSTLENGNGYWLKFPSSQMIPMSGYEIDSLAVTVAEGWNLIGSVSAALTVLNITSNPPGMITSNFFGYNGNYSTADTIYPGKGYWIKTNQGGMLILNANSSPSMIAKNRINIVGTSELPPPPPGGITSLQDIPTHYSLEDAYPNPFNPKTTIKYALKSDSKVKIIIYDVVGQVVDMVVDGMEGTGYKSAEWNAGSVASGVYFYKLEATSVTDPGNSFVQVKKMLLIK